ncbi:hypothetical protein ACGFY9_03460 [Streptomyces sp. NPDC048504]|uniref:hypothetical protein n=1 Tax=Streptomyces sp. NPDC048504 TaxID=3365559 RepID=UPI003720DEB7
MSSLPPFSPPPRSECLAQSPAVRRYGRWWLATGSGSVLAADPVLADELDRFAVAMAAADQAIADLRCQRDDPPTPRFGQER